MAITESVETRKPRDLRDVLTDLGALIEQRSAGEVIGLPTHQLLNSRCWRAVIFGIACIRACASAMSVLGFRFWRDASQRDITLANPHYIVGSDRFPRAEAE